MPACRTNGTIGRYAERAGQKIRKRRNNDSLYA
jgi:hypothetical protein